MDDKAMVNDIKSKAISNLKVLCVLLICLIVVLFSISQIISMAREAPEKKVNIAMNELTNDPEYTKITNMLKMDEALSYPDVTSALGAQAVAGIGLYDMKMNSREPEQQDIMIRQKLLEWQLNKQQNTLTEALMTSYSPLIFRLAFWLWGIIGWAASIVGSRALHFYTDRYLRKISDQMH